MPLPLRDFYTINRASELLGCSVDDLIHWARVGCIRIYIKVENAYGVLASKDLSELVGSGDFAEVMEGEKYDQSLSELDAILDRDDEEEVEISDADYYSRRAKIVYHAIRGYVFRKGDVKYLDGIGMRYTFANLNYHFRGELTEDFSLIRSVDFICKSFKYDLSTYNKILNKVTEEEKSNVVIMQGFFGLGDCFFDNYNFIRKINVYSGGCDNNSVYMPESGLCIRVMSDCEVNLTDEMMYVMKGDFIAIKEALKDGAELLKKYPYHRISNNHGWWKHLRLDSPDEGLEKKDCDKKGERISRPAITALNVLISKYHGDIRNSPTKIAEVLTAEAKEMGFDGITFDKNTVSRWIKNPSR